MTRAIDISLGSLSIGSRSKRRRYGSNSPRKDGTLQYQENSFYYWDAEESAQHWKLQVSGVKPSDPYIKQFESNGSRFIGSVQDAVYQVNWEDDLATALRNKIREGDFNAAVAIAERKSTLKLITDTSMRLVKAAKQVKRKKFKQACNTLGIEYDRPKNLLGSTSPANYWLQVNYGWSPLLSDMVNSMIATDLAQQRAEKRQKRVSVYTKDVTTKTESDSVKTSLPFGAGSTSFTIPKVTTKVSIKSKRQLAAIVVCDNPSLATVDSLGILNPASVAYELVPFSFVLDWFIPIGDWIAATPPLWGYKISQVYETMFQEVDRATYAKSHTGKINSVYREGSSSPSYSVTAKASCVGGKFHSIYVKRSSGSLAVSPPSFSFDLGTSQAITSLSLLTQQLSNFIGKK